MGFPGFDYSDPAAIFREHALLTAGTSIDYSGLDYSILRELSGSVQWPYIPREGRWWRRSGCFTDGFFLTATKRAIFHAVPDEIRSERPDGDSLSFYPDDRPGSATNAHT